MSADELRAWLRSIGDDIADLQIAILLLDFRAEARGAWPRNHFGTAELAKMHHRALARRDRRPQYVHQLGDVSD